MADYHTVYKGPEGQTTEWDDLQVKLGNKTAPEPVAKPAEWAPSEEEATSSKKDTAWLDQRTAEELEELDDELADDRFLEDYRRQRMQELKAAAQRPGFSGVQEIGANDFVREVTNAGADVWVVVHLYKEGVADCGLLAPCLEALAGRYAQTKFLKMISTACIPNYPDSNLPTVLLYKDTRCLHSLVGLRPYGGRSLTSEQVALAFNRFGAFCRAEGEEHREVSKDEVAALLQRLLSLRQQEANNGSKAEDDDSD